MHLSFRRLRLSPSMRALVQETTLSRSDFVVPLFITEVASMRGEIHSLPGVFRYSLEELIGKVEILAKQGVVAVAPFPLIAPDKKSFDGREAYAENSIAAQAIRLLKKEFPDLLIFADVALDPFTTHGHDGIVGDSGRVENEQTVLVLQKQAIALAQAGADVIAPSDMMDGRVCAIRDVLDKNGFDDRAVLSYSAKYASALYGPFRDAIQTKLSFGDKKTYQMDPANRKEAKKEALQDIQEGSDMVLIKPALSYLDVISDIRDATTVPIGAYHVSGEYAMVMAAAERGWLDGKRVLFEHLLSIKRAGADFIYTYAFEQIEEFLPR